MDFAEDLFNPCAFTFDLKMKTKVSLIASTEKHDARDADGYHWFSDWGRDTMIALPGLTLVNGRWDIAKNILAEFAAHVDRGMLPNRFPDAGEPPEYNTVDATLWFFEAARSYLQADGSLHDRLHKDIWQKSRSQICYDVA